MHRDRLVAMIATAGLMGLMSATHTAASDGEGTGSKASCAKLEACSALGAELGQISPSKAARLPLGETQGVRYQDRPSKSGVLVFSRRAGRLWRRIAGKQVEVACTRLTDLGGVSIMGEATGGRTFRAPKSRRPLPVERGAESDYCAVSLRYEKDGFLMFDTVVIVPLTQRGAIALDERGKTSQLVSVLAAATTVDEARGERFLTPKRLTDGEIERLLGREGVRVVPLSSATDSPPAGKVGYWSDGALQAVAVALSSSGRRLFIELGPAQAMRTNVARSILNADG